MNISSTQHEDVVLVEFSDPESFNAFETKTFAALEDAVTDAADAGARALVLAGAGRAFSSGADVGTFVSGVKDKNSGVMMTYTVSAAHSLLRTLRSGPPVVAAINGVAAGAALGIACACDLRLSATTATFVSGFVRIGATPDSSVSYYLPRLVGMGRAAEMLLQNRKVTADEAFAWGLVAEVVEQEALLDRALTIAKELAAGPQQALRRTRCLLDTSCTDTLETHLDREADVIIEASRGAEFAEGVVAFTKKRAPIFPR